jgi:hypothetical protein
LIFSFMSSEFESSANFSMARRIPSTISTFLFFILILLSSVKLLTTI